MMEKRTHITNGRTALIMVALALTCAVSYHRIIGYPFVYDDKAVLRDVTAYKSPLNGREVFTREYFDAFGERTYRPVASLSFFIDARLWEMSPAGAHVASVALHVVIAWLVFALLNALCGNALAALFGAAVFAAHPVHSEAVILASNREELLCALFFFASLYIYAIWRRRRRHTAGLLTIFLILFLLAMFSKEMAAGLPAAILLLEVCFRRKGDSVVSSIRKSLPFVISSAAAVLFFLALRYTLFRNSAGEVSWPGGSPRAAFLTMSGAFFLYIKQLVYPLRMCSQHVVAPAKTLFSVYGAAAAGLAALLAAGVVFARRLPLVAFAILFFFASWLPVSNIIPFGEIMAERYIYIPSFSLSVLAAWAFINLQGPISVKYGACVLIVAALTALTVRHSPVWDGDYALWSATACCAPDSATAHLNLGNALSARGEYLKALSEYRLAEGCPDAKEPQKTAYNRGLALLALGRTAEAEDAFNESARMDAAFALPHLNLGALEERRGDSAAAMRHYMRAVEISPKNAAAYYVAGRHLITHAGKKADAARAAELLRKSAELNPFDANARAALAAALFAAGNFSRAADELRAALAIDPANAPAAAMARRYNIETAAGGAARAGTGGAPKARAPLALAAIIAAFSLCALYTRRIALEENTI